MTENRTESRSRKPPARLFLETSAQIQRLAGTPNMQLGINNLIYAEPRPRIGTSAGVKREFEHTYIRFFKRLEDAAGALTKGARPVLFEDLLLEIKGIVGPYYEGGPDFLIHFYTKMAAVFGGQELSPIQVSTVFGGLKKTLELGFLSDEFFDKSSCGVWETRGFCPCDPEPDDSCLLKELCIAKRADFLASATTLASHKDRAESKWLGKNLERLKATEGKAFLELLGRNRAHVGDLIIFWEVPDGWTILSRDRTFEILKDEHRKDLPDFYMVRLPRQPGGQSCKVQIEGSPTEVEGTLVNHNAQGARVQAAEITVRERQQVTITAEELGRRVGKVTKPDKKPLDEDSSDAAFGVRFKRD